MKLQEKYKKEILPELKKQFNYKSNFEAPKLIKVVINVGFGRHTKEKAYIDNIESSLARITGQKAVLCKAKKSISAFKVREGSTIGAKVTLRGQRMYDFIEKLVNFTFPRVRDFRGISTHIVDRQGSATIGFKENSSFPEIGVEEVDYIHGLEICINTSAKNKEEGIALLKMMGFPFKKEDNK